MLDIGWPEFLVVLVVGLMVIGPKELPRALFHLGKWVRRARQVTREFQRHVDDMVRDADLEEMRDGVRKVQSIHPKRHIDKLLDPDGDMAESLKSAGTDFKKKPFTPGQLEGQPETRALAEKIDINKKMAAAKMAAKPGPVTNPATSQPAAAPEPAEAAPHEPAVDTGAAAPPSGERATG